MAQEFKAIITVLDRATEPLRRINRGAANLAAPFRSIGVALGGLGRELGLAKVGSTASHALEKVTALGTGLGGLLGPLAAVGAAAGVGGMAELAKDAAEYGKELGKSSVKTGMAVDQLARLHHISEAMNIETGVLDKGLVMLNRTLGDAARGKNKDAAALFRKLHIDLSGVRKGTLNAATVLPVLSDAFKRNENATLRSVMATTLFKKSGAELLPILTLGSAEINRLSAEYERYFGKITPQMAKAMKEGDEAFDHASLAAKGLKLSIGAALIPAMTALIVPLTNWIANNRELISQRVGEFATKVGNALASVDWNAVATSIGAIAHGFADVGKFLGPVGSTIALVTVALLPFIAAALQAVVALGQLAYAIGGFAIKLGMLAFGAVIGAIMNFITAIRAGYSAMAAFNLILAANPIGLVIIGIAALAAAAFLIWKYWKPIKKFFADLWSGIADFFESAWQRIKPIVDALAKFGEKIWRIFKWTPLGLMVQGGQMLVNAATGAGQAPSQPAVTSQPVVQGGGRGLINGRPGNDQAVKISVDLNNLPPGTKTSTKATPGIDLDVGKSFQF